MALPDEEFSFIHEHSTEISEGDYYPVSDGEDKYCRLLSNIGVLKPSARGAYRLTKLGKRMLNAKHVLKVQARDTPNASIRCRFLCIAIIFNSIVEEKR